MVCGSADTSPAAWRHGTPNVEGNAQLFCVAATAFPECFPQRNVNFRRQLNFGLRLRGSRLNVFAQRNGFFPAQRGGIFLQAGGRQSVPDQTLI